MSVSNINAQSLRPVVNFKAEQKPAENKENKKTSTTKIVGWTVAGATALAGITWGIMALKNRNVKAAAQEIYKGEKLYDSLRNSKLKNEGDKIVERFEQMRKPTDNEAYLKRQQELNNINWDATPVKRSELKQIAE